MLESLRKISKTAVLETYVSVLKPDARRIRSRDRRGETRSVPGDDFAHACAAVSWLCRAQDQGPDDGVAAMYTFLSGWVSSYPETTGYIVPTFFDARHVLEDESLAQRATRMADWLLDQQLESGGFPGLFSDSGAPARVFNTGQIIFGLVRASQETGDGKYMEAACRAGDWLVNCQDDDGCWRRNTYNSIPHTYNSRTAWAVLLLAKATSDQHYADAALANASWALDQQCDSGWFRNNAFVPDADDANLHTIAYATRGLLELGVLAKDLELVAAARKTAESLLAQWDQNKSLKGAFREDWSSPVTWRCLTGEAQLSLIWQRLDQISGNNDFTPAANDLLEQIKSVQLMDRQYDDLFGGLSGSYPINGDYERYCLVNWGAKFFVDALMLKRRVDGKAPTG